MTIPAGTDVALAAIMVIAYAGMHVGIVWAIAWGIVQIVRLFKEWIDKE